MKKKDSKQQNEPVDLPFQLERLSQLEKEFLAREESQELLKQRNAQYEQLYNTLPEELKPVLIGYSDTNTHLTLFRIKFFYKKGFIDSAATTQLLLCSNKTNVSINIT